MRARASAGAVKRLTSLRRRSLSHCVWSAHETAPKCACSSWDPRQNLSRLPDRCHGNGVSREGGAGIYVTEKGRPRKCVSLATLGDDSLGRRHLASLLYCWCGEAALTPHRSPIQRRTGSTERRSHAGRTRAGGAPAAARGHRAQTGTTTPAPRPGPSPRARALFTRAGRNGGLRGLGGTPGPRRQRASRLPSGSETSLLEQEFSKCGPRTG